MSNNQEQGRLPAEASLPQLRKQAKELRQASSHPTLSAAQHALAQSYGFSSWPKMVFAVRQSALRRAIVDGDNEALDALLKESPRLARTPLDDGATPLHVAAEMNDPAMLERLAAAGAMDAKFLDSGHSTLSWALTCWSFHAAHKLVELGHKPDLFCAAGLGDMDLLRSFWPDGKLVDQPSRTGSSRSIDGQRLPVPPPKPEDQVSDALYLAARCGQKDAVIWLLEHGADPNWRGFADGTCLAWAEFGGGRAMGDLLRQYGGSDEMLDCHYLAPPKLFPLMLIAAWGFDSRVLKARLAPDPELAKARTEWGTLLHSAAEAGQWGAAEALLEAGADRTALNHAGQTAAELAESKGFHDLAQRLR